MILFILILFTARKVSKCRVISGPNAGKYGPEITPYFDTFHAVIYYSKPADGYLRAISVLSTMDVLAKVVSGSYPLIILTKTFHHR